MEIANLKILSDDEQDAKEDLDIENGDIVFFAVRMASLFHIRPSSFRGAELLKSRGLLEIDQKILNFCGSSSFHTPMDEEAGRVSSTPFTAPVPEDIKLLKTEPFKVRGQHYDLVLNGVELEEAYSYPPTRSSKINL